MRKAALARWEMPRAPPPPKTTPIDLPQIRLAKREKSFVWGWRCGRGSLGPPRYFCIPLCTLSLKFFSALTAPGSSGEGKGLGTGETRP